MKIFIILVVTAIIFGCVTQQKIDDSKNDIQEIRFGSSGGFTGLGNEYVIKSDGKVYKSYSDSLSFVSKLNKQDFFEVKKELVRLDFENINLRDKGNMTCFINVKTSGYQNKVTWSGQTQNDNIKHFYRTLIKTLKKP